MGRVQGVGYRDALRREATRLGVTGWVRNRHDGSVEALVQGEAALVDQIIAWARLGPRLAAVVQVREAAPEAQFDRDYASFEIWPGT
jgi:acylphosphatase